MTEYRIKLNPNRCISCLACVVHCKQKNRTPDGLSLNRFESQLVADKEGRPRLKVRFHACIHCQKCVAVCPSGAMQIRPGDEFVFVDSEKCIGCGACIEACPFDIPVLNPETGKILKCNFCMDRVDQGRLPACVAGCTSKALSFWKGKKRLEA